MLKITEICDHSIKAMAYCPKDSESWCGINYRQA